MVEIILLATLVAMLFGWIALGVQDTRHWSRVQTRPTMIPVRADVEFWEDSLPRRQSLPWLENAAA